MIGAGTVINPIIKVVTTVAILAAVYFFFVKPALETTETIVDKSAKQFQQSQADARARSAAIEIDVARSRAESYAQSLQSTWPAGARAIKGCIREAETGLRMDRCGEFGQKLVHTLQSDRNFALSYADSLASQGRTGDAQRVEQCVDDAGYSAGRMQRCRDLADDLLFG